MIRFYIESLNGHDEKLVPEGKVVDEVNAHIAEGKWATLEKTNGTTEMHTKPIEAPVDDEDLELMNLAKASGTTVEKQEEKKEETEGWKEAFGKSTKSATVTNKMKGG